MGAFQLSPSLLASLFGMHDGSGIADETEISSVDVRLELMFREALLKIPNAIVIHGEELAKLALFPGWKLGTKAFRTASTSFCVDDGIPEPVLVALNEAPFNIACQIASSGRLTFCHSPQLHWEQKGKTIHLFIYIKVVYAPENHAEPQYLPAPVPHDHRKPLIPEVE